MRRSSRFVTPLGVATLVAALGAAASVPGRATGGVVGSAAGRALAAPEIIIVYGEPLRERRVIADQSENLRLLESVDRRARRPPILVGRRQVLWLALFWGPEWRATALSPERLRALRPEQANQRGMFFPATGDVPAVLSVGATVGVVSDSGLAVLSRHGVPVRLPAR
jgi:hypothetical protein